MLQFSFSSPSVVAYSAGRGDQQPPSLSNLPTARMQQTHSNTVAIVSLPQDQEVTDCDALITDVPQLQLQVKHADCLPILMYHPSGVIGAVHAGRKSTENFIVENVLHTLQNKFSIVDNLEIWLGPAICHRCYQINKETNAHYDLVGQNTKQIRSIFPESQASIQAAAICTAHHNEQFYSYRKEGKGVPMNWSGIALINKT